jgi:NAD(P)-dependent dehydrogenase (short-subunit alcohol dehydrogenase family)
MQMNGLVAIVTGASRGLGYAIAREYGKEGARVVVTARPQSPSGLSGTADQTAREIQEAGGDALAVPCDVADENQVQAMVKQVMDRYGQIDVLVNNAGLMIPSEPFLDIGSERWDELMAVNVRGPYLTCRHVLPVMIDRRRGSIINVGSRAASVPRAGGTVYCSGKAALHMFTLCLADEAEEYNIAVNVLDPGAMKSEGSAAIPWTRHDWDQRVMPADVAPSAVFLALQDAKSFTRRVAVNAEFGKTWP